MVELLGGGSVINGAYPVSVGVCGCLVQLVTFSGGLKDKVTNSHIQLSIIVFFLA